MNIKRTSERIENMSARRGGQTQNELLLTNLLTFYEKGDNMDRLVNIINGQSKISLRIIDWFVTNYAKKNFTVYSIPAKNKCSTVINGEENCERFKVFHNYKLELKAYSKVRFDPFFSQRANRDTLQRQHLFTNDDWAAEFFQMGD